MEAPLRRTGEVPHTDCTEPTTPDVCVRGSFFIAIEQRHAWRWTFRRPAGLDSLAAGGAGNLLPHCVAHCQASCVHRRVHELCMPDHIFFDEAVAEHFATGRNLSVLGGDYLWIMGLGQDAQGSTA